MRNKLLLILFVVVVLGAPWYLSKNPSEMDPRSPSRLALAAVPAARILRLTDQGEIRFYEDTGSGSNFMTLRGNATQAGDTTLTLPNDDGNATDVLSTDGSGVLSWLPATSGSLDAAYNGGSAITVDAAAVALSTSSANSLLTVNQTGAVADDVLTIANAGTGQSLHVTTGTSKFGSLVNFGGDIRQGDLTTNPVRVLGVDNILDLVSDGAADSPELRIFQAGDERLVLTYKNAIGAELDSDSVFTVLTNNTLSATFQGDNDLDITGDGKDALKLTNSGADVGITFGSLGDTNLYRMAADLLATDDDFRITNGGGKNTLTLTSIATDTGMVIGGDTNLYRAAANSWKTDDALNVVGAVDFDSTLNVDGVGPSAVTLPDSGAGFTIGGDTNLYRSAANRLTTDDSLVVEGTLTANADLTCADIFNFGISSVVDIAAGTLTQTNTVMKIDTQADASIDDLDSVVRGNTLGEVLLILQTSSDTQDVVVKHKAGGSNDFYLKGLVDATLADRQHRLMFMFDGNFGWIEISRNF